MLRANYCCNMIKEAPLGNAAEFGVANGHTLKLAATFLLTHSPHSKYYGFDWWQGLPAVTNEDGDLKVGEIKSKKSLVEDIIKTKNLTNVVLD